MKDRPVVSVIVPTYNSGRNLVKCLKSVRAQTYEDIEVVVVDSNSRDATVEIADSFGAKIVKTNLKLLGARYLGFKVGNGDVMFLLDSDQILERTVIERAVRLLGNGYDMLCLEEYTFRPKGLVQKMFEADRRLIHKFADVHSDPLEGVLLARVYRKAILGKAFDGIPETLLKAVVAHDHAIIYYEAYKLSQKVGVVSDAVWHIEPSSLLSLIKKNYRYGQSTYSLIKSGFYQDLLQQKIRFRKGALKDWKLGLPTYLLLMLKGVGYYAGYFSAKFGFSDDF